MVNGTKVPIPAPLVDWVEAEKGTKPSPIERLAEATGKSTAAVQGWLTGKYSPEFEPAIAIEDLTGVPIETFGFPATLLDDVKRLARRRERAAKATG